MDIWMENQYKAKKNQTGTGCHFCHTVLEHKCRNSHICMHTHRYINMQRKATYYFLILIYLILFACIFKLKNPDSLWSGKSLFFFSYFILFHFVLFFLYFIFTFPPPLAPLLSFPLPLPPFLPPFLLSSPPPFLPSFVLSSSPHFSLSLFFFLCLSHSLSLSFTFSHSFFLSFLLSFLPSYKMGQNLTQVLEDNSQILYSKDILTLFHISLTE